ncbi:hypothetical protein V8C86DRAFT_2853403 [Haematococcus lacustris]
MRPAALLLLSALCLAYGIAAERRLFIRDIPNSTAGVELGECQNTAKGLHIIADSHGRVCSRHDLNFRTGCCKSGPRFSCDRCHTADKCCYEYEHCVACCLDPKFEAESLSKRTLKVPRLPAVGTWDDAWSYCTGVCRTHSTSTMHENAYISPRHHCFSQLGKPMLSDPLPPGALDGVALVMGEQGQGCDVACSKLKKTCSARHLPVLNTCDRLREQVGCEAGCEAAALNGRSWPAYIDGSAPKPSRPAMCFVAPADAASQAMGCTGKDTHARRLCPCL